MSDETPEQPALGYVDQEMLRLLRSMNTWLEAISHQLDLRIHQLDIRLDEIEANTADISDWADITNGLIAAWKVEWEQANIAPPDLAAFTIAVAASTQTGGTMPATITVDTTTGVVTLAGTDDHGDAVAIPAGATANFASDNTAVLTVGPEAEGTDADGNATITATLSPVAEGTANLSAAPLDANGNPFLEADGVTPIPEPASIAQSVVAGPLGAFALGDTA